MRLEGRGGATRASKEKDKTLEKAETNEGKQTAP